jgi:hypothetical protein
VNSMNTQLIRRAVVLFPRKEYTDPAAVRHARRNWLRSVMYLRCASDSSKWILDQPIARVQ